MKPVTAFDTPARAFCLAFGWCAATFAVVGVLVPGGPAPVFVLIGAYCFWKSMPRFARPDRAQRRPIDCQGVGAPVGRRARLGRVGGAAR